MNIRTIWLAFMLAQAKDMTFKCQDDGGGCLYIKYQETIGGNRRPSACMVGVLIPDNTTSLNTHQGSIISLGAKPEFADLFKASTEARADKEADFLMACQRAHDGMGWAEVDNVGSFEAAFRAALVESFSYDSLFNEKYLGDMMPTDDLILEAHTMINTLPPEEAYGSWRTMAQKYQVEGYSTPVESQTSESEATREPMKGEA